MWGVILRHDFFSLRWAAPGFHVAATRVDNFRANQALPAPHFLIMMVISSQTGISLTMKLSAWTVIKSRVSGSARSGAMNRVHPEMRSPLFGSVVEKVPGSAPAVTHVGTVAWFRNLALGIWAVPTSA